MGMKWLPTGMDGYEIVTKQAWMGIKWLPNRLGMDVYNSVNS